jgi:murein DD-endopeptidase MepM/ murein hydrolase activator NlpD
MDETNVFSRRNLGLGEYWGRTVENRIRGVEKSTGRGEQSYYSLGRSQDSMSGDLARQLDALESLVLANPTAGSNAVSASGFALSPGWNTVLSMSLPGIGTKTNLNVVANGRAVVRDEGTAATPAFQWPFPLEYVTSEYGFRPGGFHSGIDFAGGPASAGAPVYAPANGTVTATGFNSSMGNYVILSHPGTVTRYFHFQSPSPLSVGDSVTKGVTVLGYVGNTGASFGAHLHWETYINGSPPNEEGEFAMNPRDFMAIYGTGGGTPGGFTDIRARVIISSNNSLDFEPYKIFYLGDSPPFIMNYLYPQHGLSFTGSSVNVQMDLFAGEDIGASSANIATLSAFGVFS